MYSYDALIEMINSFKSSSIQQGDSENQELLEKIVQDSDVFPEDEKEFMYQFLKEEKRELINRSENG